MSRAEDPWVDCPLDRYHRIQKSRLQFHLVKCIKNHTLSASSKMKCPFNPLHIVEAVEILHHCKTCPDSATVVFDQYDLEGPKNFSGTVSFDEVMRKLEGNLPQPHKQEKFISNSAGYDPTLNIENKPVYRTLMCESKSKRREFRYRERQRFAELEANKKALPKNASPAVTSEVYKPLREPHNLSKNTMKTTALKTDAMTEQTLHENDNQVSDFDKKIAKKVKSKIVIGTEYFTPQLAENQNNRRIANILNVKDESTLSVDSKTRDDTGEEGVVAVTDLMNDLYLLEKAENAIKERKNKLRNLVAVNTMTNPSGSTFSYRDAAMSKSNSADSNINTRFSLAQIKQKYTTNFNANGK